MDDFCAPSTGWADPFHDLVTDERGVVVPGDSSLVAPHGFRYWGEQDENMQARLEAPTDPRVRLLRVYSGGLSGHRALKVCRSS